MVSGVASLFPGAFDPVTNGHIELMKRALTLFDRLIVAVGHRGEKGILFSVEERVEMIRESTRTLEAVDIAHFDGLLVEFVEKMEASVIVRGIRAISDYEYELQMALMNRRLSNKVETVFMLPAEAYSFLSSKLIKEIAQHGGSIHEFVPIGVEKRLGRKYRMK